MDSTIKDFEAAIAELETIVKKLEEGDLALEKSLELYERGVQLSRFCHTRLEEAEKRIEILNERGDLRPAGADLLQRREVMPVASLAEYIGARRARIDEALTRFLPTPPEYPRGAVRGDAIQPRCRRQAASAHPDARGGRNRRGHIGIGRGGDRAGAAGGLRRRAHPHLLAHPRRSSGDGRRFAATRAADQPRRARRGHGHPGRRRAADRGVRAARDRAARPGARRAERSARFRRLPIAAGALRHGRRAGDRSARRRLVDASTQYSLQDMHARKTGALIRAAAVAGAIMGGGSDEADSRRRTNTAGISGWPFRSSTTFSTSKATRKISARPPAKTPRRASRPIHPSTASTRRAASPPSGTTTRSPRCDRPGCRQSRLADIAAWVIKRTN